MANAASLSLTKTSSQYAYITDAGQTGLDITGDITIDFWMKLSQLPSAAGIMAPCGKFLGTANYSYLVWLNNSDNKIYFQYSDTGVFTAHTTRFSSNGTLSSADVGVWRHICCTADVSVPTGQIYKDGTALGIGTALSAATSIYNGTSPFYVGCDAGAGAPQEFFDGKLDEMRVWTGTKTATEVPLLMYQQSPVGAPNLVAYWKFNNGYTDFSGNGNTLTPAASPTFSVDTPFKQAYNLDSLI